MNRVFFSGRLSKDPEVRYTRNNTKVAEYNLAVDRPKSSGTEQKQTDFFKVVAWQSNADFVESYLRKGMKIIVEGQLRNNNYEDKNGNKVYSNEILAERHEFCETKKFDRNGNELTTQEAATPTFTEVYGNADVELPF